MKPYVVSEVPKQRGVFYCHHRDYPDIAVFGSVGDKKKANSYCRLYNSTARDMKRRGLYER